MKSDLKSFFESHYDLDDLESEISNKDVAFLIYDDTYYYYFENDKLVDCNLEKKMLDIIKEFSKRFKIKIFNYYPVCFCKNTLVMALRVSSKGTNLIPIKVEDVRPLYKDLIKYHRDNCELLYVSTNVKEEIEMSKKYINRYNIHKKIIKKYILTDKKRRKREFKLLLDRLIPNKKSIIDVSCGDNSDALEIANNKKYDLIVGNDICVNYLLSHDENYVFYTNDNIEINLLSKSCYDVAFCKNTLHHMNSLTNIKKLFSFLDRISSDTIIIVEIMNPQESGGFPRFLNKYLYTMFLKDVGSCFLNENQFKQVIEGEFSNYKIEYDCFTNVLGKYMVAKIIKE